MNLRSSTQVTLALGAFLGKDVTAMRLVTFEPAGTRTLKALGSPTV